jgi:hypothetical protein
MLCALGSALLLAVSAATFSTEYTVAGQANAIDGWEPEAEGKYPVIVLLPQNGQEFIVPLLTDIEAFFEFPGGIAGITETCRFLFAVVQLPREGQHFETVDEPCAYQQERALALFSSPGNALAQICSRPKADCSNGVGILGIVDGAMVGILGAGLPDLAFPIAAVASIQTGVADTSATPTVRLDCLVSSAVETYLPKNKRRSAISSTDGRFGSTPEEVLAIQKEFSGFDCGDAFNCIQEDGSGYIVFDTSTIGKVIQNPLWAIWSVRGQDPYSCSELLKWLHSTISAAQLPAACEPGCVKQYSLPMASRRLLFASMPAEAELCPAPDVPNFGEYLTNKWLIEATLIDAIY